MIGDDGPQFGTPGTGQARQERPGAYAVALVEGQVLVVATPAGLYLPGGGIDAGETAEETLRREVREETGYRVATLALLGRARQFVGAATNKVETFYAVAVVPAEAGGAEQDHRPRWVSVDEATAGLVEEAQRWAVRLAVERLGR